MKKAILALTKMVIKLEKKKLKAGEHKGHEPEMEKILELAEQIVANKE